MLLTHLTGAATAAVIAGTVVENLGGRPLAHAQVFLEPREGPVGRSTQTQWTDRAGGFSFTGLVAGSYLLRVERPGFADAEYGQLRYLQPGTPILVEPEGSFHAVVRMYRLAAISGSVVDSNGVGIPGMSVRAYLAGDRPRQVRMAQTDDRGVYRLAGLRPGRYLIRTAPRRMDDGVDLMPTYHPQTASTGEATPVQASLDREIEGIDITPVEGRLARIDITISGGQAALGLLISDAGTRQIQPEANRLTFDAVEPGRHEVVVVSADAQRAGYAELQVATGNLSQHIAMDTAPRLRLECESGGKPVQPDTVSLFFRRSEFEETPQRLACGQTLAFSPGRWQVAAVPPADRYVAAILDAGAGKGIHELVLRPGEDRELRIQLGDSPATISGQVKTADGDIAVGAPVFLRAVGEELRRRVGGTRSTRADAQGVYRIPGLPPGTYELISSFQIQDPDSEGWPEGYSSVIDVREGEASTLDLTLQAID